MKYEILDGQTVINTIEADPSFLIAAYPDGNYREVTEQEPPPPVAPTVRTLPAGAFRLRFNFAERTRVELASIINPAAPAAQQQMQAAVKTFYADLTSQRVIDLSSPGVLRGCQLLDGLGVLDADWRARIIDADPKPEELQFPG